MRVFLLRHAETAWTLTGQHTGKTDLELTAAGRADSVATRPVFASLLGGRAFDAIYVSPRRRAQETAELALGEAPKQVSELLAEVDYGDYAGLTPAQIQARAPGWSLWNDGCPNGESVAEVRARADQFIELLRAHPPDAVVCAVSHGHMLRFLVARLLGLEPAQGRLFGIRTASIAELTQANGAFQLALWNRTA